MKHKLSITLILLGMFLVTQIIGIIVVGSYEPHGKDLPFGLKNPSQESNPSFVSIIISFLIAFGLVFALMKLRLSIVIRAWFLFVVALSLGISINALIKGHVQNSQLISIIIAFFLAFWKIMKPGILIHNLTELFIYPGIAAVFVPLLTPVTIIFLLLLISFYDMWAVWKSGVMQKMAKFQIEELNIFGGFLISSASKKVKKEIAKIRQKYKGKKIPKRIANKKFKVNLAILGGGDVIFPIIASGVFAKNFGLLPAIFITIGAFLALTYLMFRTEKGKSYPAMPYISLGILAAISIWKVFFCCN
ncbi:hypothetical protein D6829_02850 [Candidatus Pacearchaeota archaeon]|nr:MAG: hypothetical protein D6829_02850 [Candidatus Pacearchaeota archaeon]